MRKVSLGLALTFLLLPAAPAAGSTINGPITYDLRPWPDSSGKCVDIFARQPGGTVRVVAGTSSCEHDGQFSASGLHIAWRAFDDGPETLHVADRRGRAARTVAETTGGGWAWSGTDDRLVYTREPELVLMGDDIDLWVTDAFGHEHHPVTDTSDRAELAPSWSPDGSRIAFVAEGDLYTIAPDGTDEVRLTEGAEVTEDPSSTGAGVPAWSPDSSKIAFVSARDDAWLDDGGMQRSAEIYVVPSAGGEIRNVSNLPATMDRDPQWLDDRRLVWIADHHSECETNCDADLYGARWDGTRRRVVVGGPTSEESPTVSPDGRWIAFNRNAPRGRWGGVFKVRSNGTALTKLIGMRHARLDVDDWAPR